MIYTGIGSRNTPKLILEKMYSVAKYFAEYNYVLRTGGAPGADTAFLDGALAGGAELGPVQGIELYLPWPNFNGLYKGLYPESWSPALKMAEEFHPAWYYVKPGAKKLHARNCFQIMGLKLDQPTAFVLCWTEGGQGKGGTGQALRIAKTKGIPIFDLGIPEVLKKEEWFKIIASGCTHGSDSDDCPDCRH